MAVVRLQVSEPGPVVGTATLAVLMDDEQLRRRFATAAVEKAQAFDISKIAAHWEALFEELSAQKRR